MSKKTYWEGYHAGEERRKELENDPIGGGVGYVLDRTIGAVLGSFLNDEDYDRGFEDGLNDEEPNPPE